MMNRGFAIQGLLIDAADRQAAAAIFAGMSPAQREAHEPRATPLNVSEAESWWRAWHNGSPPAVYNGPMFYQNQPQASAPGRRDDQPRLESAADLYARRRGEVAAMRGEPGPRDAAPAASHSPATVESADQVFARRQRETDAIRAQGVR